MFREVLWLALVILQTTTGWQIYTSLEDHFQLKYPPKLQLHTSIISDYEKTLELGTATSRALTLRVIDLNKYLPKTNTPNIQEYLKTFKAFPKYQEMRIAGKRVYGYVLCGRAACAQEAVFIQDNRMYDFSIGFEGSSDSMSFEKIPAEIQAIIASIEFLA